jgi:CubicO group peptidase (beta-lactamase class C family)
MSRRLTVRIALSCWCLVALIAVPLGGQEPVRQGPPPEIRALVDAFLKALEGDATAWEAMAQERFSADHLTKTTPADRKALFEKIRTDFGKLTFQGARRSGPEAPLDLQVTGANGATGTISLELDSGRPPRIANINVQKGGPTEHPGAAGVPPPPIHGRMTPDELTQALDGYLSRLAADEVFSGAALVAKGDAVMFQKAYGTANRADRIPNTIGTRFNVGSINKAFTRIAIEQLVAQGLLADTDTLGKFFPEYPQAASRSATVQQLLSHTAGIADFFGPEFAQAPKDHFRSNADYFRFVSARPPLFAPGARNQYCNGCYVALGAIVERVSGMPYERYVATHVFTPAGMMQTGYPQTDAIESHVAVGYTRRTSDGQLRSNVYLHGAAGSAAGGGYSTVGDLFAYVRASRAGTLPGSEAGIAGGAPGTSAVVEAGGDWTVVVLTNLDPPAGERVGVAIMRALQR